MKASDTPAPDNDTLCDSSWLEFPDWNGMLPRRSSMTFEEAVHWNDEMLSLFPPKKWPQLEAKLRCYAELIL